MRLRVKQSAFREVRGLSEEEANLFFKKLSISYLERCLQSTPSKVKAAQIL
jgi:hypothetical protein